MADPNDLPVNIDATYPDEVNRPGRKIHQQHHDIVHQVLRDHETAIDALESSPGGVSSVDGDTGAVDLSGSYVPLAGDATIDGLKDFTTAPTINGAPIAGAVPDADADTKGVLILTGDLGGTADAPTVPGLELKLDVSAAAPLSDNTPLVSSGAGSAGDSNDASRGNHVHPAQDFALSQPLILEPAAIDEPALVIRALAGQTDNLVEWRHSDDTLIAAVGAGVVDASDGFGFPQVTGFPRLRGSAYSTYGKLNCTGAFQVEKNFFLVGVGGIDGGQANYGNTGLSWADGELQIVSYSSGANAQFRALSGFRMPCLVLGAGTTATPMGTAQLEVTPPAANVKGQVTQGFTGQTADLAQWQDDASSTGFAITAAQLPRWTKAANVQTTVGAAGGASALPASPTKYLKVVGDDNVVYVVPAFAAA